MVVGRTATTPGSHERRETDFHTAVGEREDQINIIDCVEGIGGRGCLSTTTGGAAFAKNAAVKQSSGTWLCFIDADDTMMPTRVEKQIEIGRTCYEGLLRAQRQSHKKLVIDASDGHPPPPPPHHHHHQHHHQQQQQQQQLQLQQEKQRQEQCCSIPEATQKSKREEEENKIRAQIPLIGCNFVRDPPSATPRYTSWLNSLSCEEKLMSERFVECTLIQSTWFLSRAAFYRIGGYHARLSSVKLFRLLRSPVSLSPSSSSPSSSSSVSTSSSSSSSLYQHYASPPPYELPKLAEDLDFFYRFIQRSMEDSIMSCPSSSISPPSSQGIRASFPSFSSSYSSSSTSQLSLRVLTTRNSCLCKVNEPLVMYRYHPHEKEKKNGEEEEKKKEKRETEQKEEREEGRINCKSKNIIGTGAGPSLTWRTSADLLWKIRFTALCHQFLFPLAKRGASKEGGEGMGGGGDGGGGGGGGGGGREGRRKKKHSIICSSHLQPAISGRPLPATTSFTFSIWGAGRDGKRFYRSLPPRMRRCVRAFLDVDEKKIKHGAFHYVPTTKSYKHKRNRKAKKNKKRKSRVKNGPAGGGSRNGQGGMTNEDGASDTGEQGKRRCLMATDTTVMTTSGNLLQYKDGVLKRSEEDVGGERKKIKLKDRRKGEGVNQREGKGQDNDDDKAEEEDIPAIVPILHFRQADTSHLPVILLVKGGGLHPGFEAHVREFTQKMKLELGRGLL